MTTLHIFLMAPQGGQSSIGAFLPFILIAVVFYFFMIRPQTKKAKDLKKFRESIAKGSRIVTIGGIHGKVVDTKDTTLLIEVEDGSKLRIERAAVSQDFSAGLQGGEIEAAK
jgi:preprotein translocase subunit YajC